MLNHSVAAIVDTETTGLAQTDELIEIAVVLFKFDMDTGTLVEVLDEYQGLRYPNVSIKREASKIHGLTKRDLYGKTLDYNYVNNMFSQAEFLIAHNVSFDRRFVVKEFPATGNQEWYCSMKGIRWQEMGYQSKGLQVLLKAHNISPGNAHRALDDTRALLELITSANEFGTAYLKELVSGNLLTSSRDQVAQSAPNLRTREQKKSSNRLMLYFLIASLFLLLICSGCMLLGALSSGA